jgi:hypothetical protein
MATDNTVTLIGNLTNDPELRFTANGAAVANFRLAVTPQVHQGDQWTDGETSFFHINCWRQPWITASARPTWRSWTCPLMWLSWSGPAWSWPPARAWPGCGWASGHPCWASAATSRPRAAATRPPWGRCGGPGSPTPSAAGEVTPSH